MCTLKILVVEFGLRMDSKDSPMSMNSAVSGIVLPSQQIVPVYLNNVNNLKPVVHNQIHCVPMSSSYHRNTQGIVSTTSPGHGVSTSPITQYNGGAMSKGGTMCFSGQTFSPYKHNILERRLVVLNSPGNSPREPPTVTIVNRQNLFPGVMERNDVTQHTKSILINSLQPSTSVSNTLKGLPDSHQNERTTTIILNSPIHQPISNSKTQKDVKRVTSDDLTKLLSKIPSPKNAETTKKILMKCKINMKTAKKEKIRSMFKNNVTDSQKSKVKDKLDGERLKVKKNIVQGKKTKLKSSKSCTSTSGRTQEKESNPTAKRTQRKGSKTNLKVDNIQKADMSSASRWQKMSNIIQILEISGMTKYKMCEIPIFFMNDTDERLASDNSDDTSAYILCSSNDSILAVMVNCIRPDQYRMAFTGENYPVKPRKLSESMETFSLKKCIFTPYVGSVSCLSEGTHIVVFGEFTDDCMVDKADGEQTAKLTSSVDLAQMVSELQSVWSGDDSLVMNPDIKPKCINPLYKAMCRILKLKFKKNTNQGATESLSKAKKAKYQLKVNLKESDKPFLTQRKTSKTNIVKKSKSKHEDFYKELIDVLEKREG